MKIVLLTKDKDLERLRQIVNFVLNDEMKAFQLAGMLRAAGNQIDPRGFQRAVAQHVGQLGHIPAGAVKHPGKEVPQVVGEHLAGGHAGLLAQGLHLGPNLLAGDGAAPAGAEDLPRGRFLPFGVLQQLFPQPLGNEDGADFPL